MTSGASSGERLGDVTVDNAEAGVASGSRIDPDRSAIDIAFKPKFLRIAGFWYPRGGIPIDVFWQTGNLPKSVSLPDPGVSPYRGR